MATQTNTLVRSAARHITVLAPLSPDPLDGDRLDYTAWLLPPLHEEPAERLIRQISVLSGWAALSGGLAVVALLLF